MIRKTLPLLALLLLSLIWLTGAPALAQTIPTRTPTPPPGGNPSPTSPPPPPPATQPPPPATQPPPPPASETPQPTAAPSNTPPRPSATATRPATGTTAPTSTSAASTPVLSPTTEPLPTIAAPLGGQVVRDAQCGVPPTAQLKAAGSWYSGPDISYPVGGALAAQEVRPIVARYAYSAWWLLQISPTEQGWLPDQALNISGYTNLTPILLAPPLNEVTPTPAAVWNPTPMPACVCFGLVSLQPLFEPTNVRSGPGSDYDVVGVLSRRDIRLVTGRYGFGDWWQIDMGNGTAGWVINSAVNVLGHIGVVPVVNAPPLNGVVPTPGPVWNPPLNPLCANITPVAVVLGDNGPVESTTLPSTPGSPAASTPDNATQVSQAASPPSNQAITPLPTAVVNGSPTPAPRPTSAPTGGNSNSVWLLVAGGALVAGGLAGFVLTRRKPA